MITFSTQFNEYSPEVLEACVIQGAAKVAGMITEDSIKTLAEQGLETMSPQGILAVLPELEIVRKDIEPNGRSRMMLGAAFRYKSAEDSRFLLSSHQDEECPEGITLVIPVFGEKAFFAASNQPFLLEEDGSVNVEPHLLWEYGPRDVIFLRQGLRKVNQRRVHYDMVHHAGRSNGKRLLRMLDFRGRSLKLPIKL